MWLANKSENRVEINIVISDTGCGMPPEQLDALFRELEQVQTEDDEGLEEKLAGDKKAIEGTEGGKRTLGLGLALVARIVRNMNGQLRVKSEAGKGSRFVIQFWFDLPQEDEKNIMLDGAAAAGVAPPSDQPTTPPVETGDEVMLVTKSAQKPAAETPREMIHRKSTESMKSIASGSSARSDVDRLIEAIQEPAIAPGAGNEPGVGRSSNVKGDRRLGSSSSAQRPSSALARTQSVEGHGVLNVLDSKTPIKPIRMPGETSTGSTSA